MFDSQPHIYTQWIKMHVFYHLSNLALYIIPSKVMFSILQHSKKVKERKSEWRKTCFLQIYAKRQRFFTLTRKFLIWRLPSSCRDMRGSLPSRFTPSFSQLMVGTGSPDAWHFSRAILSIARVWFAGPCRMIGGGLSVKTDQKWKKDHIYHFHTYIRSF